MELIYGIDLFGTFIFAISGILAAIDKKLDVVGALVIGFVTALGGGTLRDILIGRTPVGWMTDSNYLFIVLFALPVCYFFRGTILKAWKSIFVFDTIGIGLFTVLGLQKGLSLDLPLPICLIMGVISAVFGGVTRDIILNEIPLIFRKEIYASACVVGGLVYLALNQISVEEPYAVLSCIIVVILIRFFAVRFKWHLPYNPR